MKHIAKAFCILILLPVAMLAADAVTAQAPTQPPATATHPVTESLHGVEITDPYRWLEDQESPETRAWIDAQNAYADSFLNRLMFRKKIEKRLNQLERIDQYGTPVVRGGRYFYTHKRVQDEQALLCVRDGLQGKERVLVDPHPMSKDHTTSVNFAAFSNDGALIAYEIRQGGDDRTEVRILKMPTGEELPDRLPKAYNEGLSFTQDDKGCYYVRLTPLVGRRVFYHALGTDNAQDVEVFGKETNAEDGIDARVSENGHWLLVNVWHGWSKNDLYVKDLVGDGPIHPLVKGQDLFLDAAFAGDRLLARTDWRSPTRRIVEIDLSDPTPDRWREVVPASADSIESYALTGGKIFVQYLHDANTRVKIFSLDGKAEGDLTLPGLGTAGPPAGTWDDREAFYTFETFTAPPTIYHYDVATGGSAVWAKPNVPLKASDFETKQVWVTSKDGIRVPMFLIYKKGLAWDGKRPTLLTGYGGFNSSEVPYFSTAAILWAEQGGVLAMPNLRGGGEYGEAWHRAGMQDKKQNVFDDFIAAAEWLIHNGVTNPAKLAIQGASNGGLLVGAALTQRPDLFRAVVCGYPLLDMVRYHKFLQGPQWVPEYGSAEDAAQFRTLYAYSPYHHVQKGARYPAVLFVTGDADTRVAPLHARKMTALLQSANASDRPILLHYQTTTGHSGGQPLSKEIEDQALEHAFLFWQLGVF